MKTISNLFILILCLSLSSSLSAQFNGSYDLRFTIYNVDCANNRVDVDIEIKATNPSTTFNMGYSNHRFSYNTQAINNPTKLTALNFEGVLGNSLYFPFHNTNGTFNNIVSYNTFYSSGPGVPVGTTWMGVGRVRFNIVDSTKCMDLTFLGLNQGAGQGCVANEVGDFNENLNRYNLYSIIYNQGLFQPGCLPQYCPAQSIPCSKDSYEPNDIQASAYQTYSNSFSTFYNSLICPAGDEDWYAFNTTPTKRRVLIKLSNLPANYDLAVYNNAGNLISNSTRAGLQNELISYNNLAVGNYFVKVSGATASTSSPTASYTLNIQVRNTTIVVGGGGGKGNINNGNTGGYPGLKSAPDLVPTVFPNPASDHFFISLPDQLSGTFEIELVDATGKTILGRTHESSTGRELKIALNNISTGLYFVKIRHSEDVWTQKLTIAGK